MSLTAKAPQILAMSWRWSRVQTTTSVCPSCSMNSKTKGCSRLRRAIISRCNLICSRL